MSLASWDVSCAVKSANITTFCNVCDSGLSWELIDRQENLNLFGMIFLKQKKKKRKQFPVFGSENSAFFTYGSQYLCNAEVLYL
jgi:hypothetical protein